MSDTMLLGVLRMPYELAMSTELSRRQFYERALEAADRIAEAVQPTQERKPLTEQEIWDAVQHGVIGGIGFPTKALAVARAIEAAHGIGAQPKGDA